MSLAVLAAFAALVYLTRSVYTWRLLGMIAPLFILGVAVYSLTYFMTTLTRSARTGLSFSFGLVLMDLLLPMAVRRWWQIHFPSAGVDLLADPRSAMDASSHFLVSAATGGRAKTRLQVSDVRSR